MRSPLVSTAPAAAPCHGAAGARSASGRLTARPAGELVPFRRPEGARPAAEGRRVPPTDCEDWSDHQLVRAAREDAATAPRLLDALFRRHQRRVAAWALRWCDGRAEDAADLVQEVFLRAQEKLAGFRFESAFTTWLYLVTRTVALNRADAARRRPAASLEEHELDPEDPAEPADEAVSRAQQVALLRAAMAAVLDPLEARVLHLHFTDGLTLPVIDRLLGLDNKSGSKAYLVAAKRKLRRHFEEKGAQGRATAEEEA
ncbi:MAG: sigma-70 family RNA polymerase sigma factor [Thermoanaerobaculia bacterium]|nr:MAG: sigma-70 family RNA polymerase sigma factor [Thermoanaerobaculia bacterium]